jgi:ABC-2 type transport system permease protein
MNVRNIVALGRKELLSLRYDVALVLFMFYSFTYWVYAPAKHARMELVDASIAIVDEDRSPLSRRIADALQPPYFLPPAALDVADIDTAMEQGRYTFVVDVPPEFEAHVLAGRRPSIQVDIDATAMSQAGQGASYLQNVIARELRTAVGANASSPVELVTRARFNPNLESTWFTGVMQIINNVTLLALFLSGAAFMREREHGTLEHLLVMPLRPVEIMLAKVIANGLVIVVAAVLSLEIMVRGVLGVPIGGSVPLFALAVAIYLFSITSLGIFLATLVRSMPQFALLAFPTFIVMNLLSGSVTPFESMPAPIRAVMQFVPSTHFVRVSQAILYRGADISIVWRDFALTALVGAVFFAGALLRFRRTVTLAQG